MYFLKRILFLAPLLVLISFLSFALVRMAPGGPFDRERKPASALIEKRIRAKYHLDEPLWRQYGIYLDGLLHGDFGPSLKQRNHSVNEIIAQGLPISMTLGWVAFCFAVGLGIPLGFLTSIRRGRMIEFAGTLFALLLICVPALVVGPVLILWLAIKLNWFPVALWGGPEHVVLPVVTLGLYFAGRVSRLMREGFLEVLRAEYITTARAKGLSEAAVFWRHAFRPAVLPVISYAGPLLADLLTGSFVVESLFQIPGIGVFLVNGSLNRDYTLIVGLVILYAAMLLVLNLLVDFAYGWLDPRVRLAS